MNSSLLSAGSSLKLWTNSPAFNEVTEWRPSEKPISDCSWSLDGRLVATCVEKGVGPCYITRLSSDFRRIEGQEEIGRGCTTVAASSDGRYVLGGREDGVVINYDLKNKKIQKTYDLSTNGLTTVSLHHSDRNFAAAANNDVYLINTVTAERSSPLKHTSAVQYVKYSLQTKHLLATACNSGDVCLWNSSTKQQMHCFKSIHHSPVTCITHSPINERLMMSSGLDRKIMFYDCLTHQNINKIFLDSPATAVDLHSDGYTIVGGTTRGTIHVYDLRQLNKPVHTMHCAHTSSVKVLKFQLAELFSKKKRQTTVSSPNHSNHSVEFKTPSVASASRNSSYEIFSPLSPENGKRIQHPDGGFSPNFTKEKTFSPNLNFRSEIADSPKNHLPRSAQKTPINNNNNNNNINHSITPKSISNGAIEDINEERKKDTNSFFLHSSIHSLPASQPLRAELSEDGRKGAAAGDSNVITSQIQTELIRQIVREELDDVYERLHSDIVATRLNLISTMASYRDEIVDAIHQGSLNDDLMRENERLRSEISRLNRRY